MKGNKMETAILIMSYLGMFCFGIVVVAVAFAFYIAHDAKSQALKPQKLKEQYKVEP